MTGLGVGLASVLVPLYIAESAPTRLRGALGSANQFLIAGGVVVINSLGLPIVQDALWWKNMVLISAIPVVVVLVGILTVGVETPRWLISKGKNQEAEKSLRFLRGPEYNISPELAELQKTANSSAKSDDLKRIPVNKWNFLFCKALRPLLLGVCLQLLQQWSGINAIMFHTTELFVPVSDNLTAEQQTTALQGAILVNVVQFIMCGVTVISMNKAGRRFFLMLSYSGMGIAGLLMGIAFQYEWSTLARMIVIMVYLSFFSLGSGPVTWLVCSEIYPSAVRELAMALSTLVNWISAFGVTAALSPMRNAIKDQGVFWLFAAVSFLGVALVYFLLPETKDKSLEEIENYFIPPSDDYLLDVQK